jgi:hypothetical protein
MFCQPPNPLIIYRQVLSFIQFLQQHVTRINPKDNKMSYLGTSPPNNNHRKQNIYLEHIVPVFF